MMLQVHVQNYNNKDDNDPPNRLRQETRTMIRHRHRYQLLSSSGMFKSFSSNVASFVSSLSLILFLVVCMSLMSSVFVTGQGIAAPYPTWIESGTYQSTHEIRQIRRKLLIDEYNKQQQRNRHRRRLQQQQHNYTSSDLIEHPDPDLEKIQNEYTYIPKYIPLGYCRYMTNEECQVEDERSKYSNIMEWNKRNRNLQQSSSKPQPVGPVAEYKQAIAKFHKDNLQQQQNERRTVSTTTLSTVQQLHDHHQRYLAYEQEQREILRQKLQNQTFERRFNEQNHRHLAGPNPAIGTGIRVIVLLVRFIGHENRVLPTRDYFDTVLNGDGITTTNPVGSMKEWLRFSSLGKYRVVFDVKDWQTSNQTESQTAAGASALVGPSKLQGFFTNILTKLDSSIPWTDGYVTDFGLLNHLVVLHSGYAAEMGKINCLPTVAERDPKNRIWSQGIWSTGTSAWTSKEFYQLNGFAVTSAFDLPSCTGNTMTKSPSAQMGQIVHEYNHGFGLPDLYDQDTNDTPITLGGTAKFAIMSNGFGWLRNSAKPGHHDPWCRAELNWIDPIEITENGFYAIQPSEISGQVYKLSNSFPSMEYLLIENRQPIKWDSDMPTSTGIVIWHIDENQNGQTTRGYPGKTNWPNEHYEISVVQADRKYEIEQGINMGDENDFWKKNQTLGPGPTFPNTDSIRFGEQKATGITIKITSDPGFIMTFQISGLPDIPPPTAAPAGTTTNSTIRSTRGSTTTDASTTFSTIHWILSMFLGSAAMIGILAFIFI